MILTFQEFIRHFFDHYPEDITIETFNNVVLDKNDIHRKRLMQIDHDHYPIVYEDGESPKIDDMVCRHFNCNKVFNNRTEFIQHLKDKGCYTQSYTKSHNMISDKYTICYKEYICNSFLCNFKTRSLYMMIQHHILLGSIKTPNLSVKDYIGFYDKLHDNKKKINVKIPLINNVEDAINILYKRIDTRPEECMVCCSEKPVICYYPCMHIICCKPCLKLIKDNKCPLCRLNYTDFYCITLENF